MERSRSWWAHIRSLLGHITGPWEVALIAAAAILAWWLALGWNWPGGISGAETGSISHPARLADASPGVSWGWTVVAVAVAAGVGWLARRGHGIAGTFAIFVPIIFLSGWRLAASSVVAWPINLASLVFVLCLVCIAAGTTGTWLRHRASAPPAEAQAGSEDQWKRSRV